MTSEQLFVLCIVVILVIVIANTRVGKSQHRITAVILGRLKISFEARQPKPHEPEQPVTDGELEDLAAEEKSKAELERLQRLVRDRKQIAADTDISFHLWGFYKSHFRHGSPQLWDCYIQDGEWYDVNILHVSTNNGLNNFEFELKGARYKFVDDEEQRGWGDNRKFFTLFLYDDSDRCLIEVPMKMWVDDMGRHYSISSDGPNAFLPGDWVKDFINVILKHQHLRNQVLRVQKHEERLREIEDLKGRFGIAD